MYNYKFFFRSILVVIFVLLIISPGCTFWAKANYREFGKQGFDDLKKINDIHEEYGSSIGNLNENNVGQYIVFLSIIEERIKNANESFDRMEGYAITKDEKELASSLANSTDYMARSMGKFREMLEVVNKYNGRNISNPDPYVVSEFQKIKTETETYSSLANLELRKAQVILDRMPEYQKDFADLYELGTGQAENVTESVAKKDSLKSFEYVSLLLNISLGVIALLPLYFLVSHKNKKKIEEFLCLVTSLGLFIISLLLNVPIVGVIAPIIFFASIGYLIIEKKNYSIITKLGLSFLIPIGLFYFLIGLIFFLGYIGPYPDSTDAIVGLLMFIGGILLFGIYFYYVLGSISKRDANPKDNIEKEIHINSDKQDNSLEYLKSFDKLTEKEIVAFLYLRNNPEISRDKLIEMFGDEIISSLIAKGHFREENVD